MKVICRALGIILMLGAAVAGEVIRWVHAEMPLRQLWLTHTREMLIITVAGLVGVILTAFSFKNEWSN